MATHEPATRAQLRSAAPVLCVSDIRSMLACFEQQLGFRVVGQAGDLPSWASLQRDGIEIMLVCGDYPAPAADWAVYLYVTDADGLYAELLERGAQLLGPPVDKPYRCREFEARLPDGRLIAFASAIG
jgi:hypothetical protein